MGEWVSAGMVDGGEGNLKSCPASLASWQERASKRISISIAGSLRKTYIESQQKCTLGHGTSCNDIFSARVLGHTYRRVHLNVLKFHDTELNVPNTTAAVDGRWARASGEISEALGVVLVDGKLYAWLVNQS
jgi:hypothetical protein